MSELLLISKPLIFQIWTIIFDLEEFKVLDSKLEY